MDKYTITIFFVKKTHNPDKKIQLTSKYIVLVYNKYVT